jgi:predicted peptidase
MIRSVRIAVALATLALFAATTNAQAPPSPSVLRVQYNTLKTRINPEGTLKEQIDQIDREIADANRLGRFGEVRRLYAKGTALLNKRPWTEADDFDTSLILRTDRIVVDSSTPYRVRLEQIFEPDIKLASSLSARVSIRAATPAGAGRGDLAAAGPAAAELARFSDVSRDLRYAPFAMDLNLASVPDGAHTIEVDVLDGEKTLGNVTLRVNVQKGLDARLASLESAAAAAPAEVRADIRYPADYIRKVNRGVVDLGSFNVTAELTTAEGVAAAAKGGKNPFAGKTGDFERHYLLEAAGEIMPYRVYVPKSYNASRAYPLIVGLHGLGANEDSIMDGYGRRVPTLAEERGYIVVSPLGYRVDGFYGYSALSGGDAAGRRRAELSEQDVMEVLRRARADYRIDDSRIYLMGHSMGAIGTWAIAAKYPEIWAALGPFAGLGNAASVERMKHIPQFVVHGDKDPTVSVNGSRSMVEAMKKLGVDHTYVEVPGGNHTDVVAPNIGGMFDFFDTKRKKSGTM